MQDDGKPVLTRKITIEIAVRLIVKTAAVAEIVKEIPEILNDGNMEVFETTEPNRFGRKEGLRVWKVIPVWKVSMTADADPQFIFENTNPNSRDVCWYDGNAVATEFLNLKSPEAALAFFEKYYLGEVNKPDDDKKIRWSEIQSIQKVFLSALANESMPQNLQAFVFQSLEVVLQHDVKVVRTISPRPGEEKFDAVVGIAECKDVLSALRAVVFLSRGSVWRQCGNPKCEMWFKPGRPDQIYHNQGCTRQAIANRFNERTRKAKAKRRRK
ncbi:MAG: hypothetical protein ABSG77_11255 [Candidatus Acidiferrum sp.]|jgi:hypothetical protein